MSIKTSKRIALGVIASLVFAPFAAIAPASAAATQATAGTITNPIVAVGGTSNVVIAWSGAATSTVAAIKLTQAPAGITAIPGDDELYASSESITGGSGDAGTNNTLAAVSSNATSLTIAAANFTTPGTYVFKMVTGGATGDVDTQAEIDTLAAAATAATATIRVLAGSSTTTSLTAANDKASYTAASGTNAVKISVLRNSLGVVGDGNILGRVDSTPATGTHIPVGTVFGQTDIVSNVDANLITGGVRFDFDTASTASATALGAGTYTFTFFVDANSNAVLDSGEVSITHSVTIGGAADAIAITLSKTVLAPEANYNTFTVTATVTDEDALPSSGSIFIQETESDGDTAAPANYTNIDAETALVRVGSTNQYIGTFTVNSDSGITTSALTYVTVYVGTGEPDRTGVVAKTASLRVVNIGDLNDTAGVDAIMVEEKEGLGTYTSGARNQDLGIVHDGTSTSALTSDSDVTTHKYTFNALAGDEGKYLKVEVARQGNTSSTVIANSYNLVKINEDLTATYTVTATSPAEDDSYQIEVVAANADDPGFTVTWADAAPAWATSPSSNIKAKYGDKITITGTLSDQFGRAYADKDIYVDVTGRSAGRYTGKTNASGQYAFTWTDASTSTTVVTDSVVFKYDYLATAAATSFTTLPSTARVVTYSATGPAVASVVVTAPSLTNPRPIDFGQTATGLPDSGSTVTYTAIVRDAAGAGISGVLITFAGGAGDLFTTPVTKVTGTDGTISIVAYRQLAGTASVTATAAGITSAVATPSVKWTNNLPNNTAASAPYTGTAKRNARYIALASDASSTVPEGILRFTATVTDRFGNAVEGATVTFTESGVGRFMTGQTTTDAVTNSLGQVSVDLSTNKTETGQVSVTAILTTTGGASQLDDIANRITVNDSSDGTNTTGTAVKVIAGITAAVKSATATATVAAAPTPEVVVPPVAPTLTGSLNGRVLLFGACQVDEGDMIIYVKSPGKAWQEKAKTLECVAGEFDGSIRAPKTTKLYRVKQEGTGLWSSSVLIRR